MACIYSNYSRSARKDHGQKLNTTIIRRSLASWSGDNNSLELWPNDFLKRLFLFGRRHHRITFFYLALSQILSIHYQFTSTHPTKHNNITSCQPMQLSVATNSKFFRSVVAFCVLRIFCFLWLHWKWTSAFLGKLYYTTETNRSCKLFSLINCFCC